MFCRVRFPWGAVVDTLLQIININLADAAKFHRREVFDSGLIAVYRIFPGAVRGQPLLIQGAEGDILFTLVFSAERRNILQCLLLGAKAFFSRNHARFFIAVDAVAACYFGCPLVAAFVYAPRSVSAF